MIDNMIRRMLESLLRQAQIGQSRSSVINPLQWTIVILLFAILATAVGRYPLWLPVTLVVLLVLIVGLFISAFVYFMAKNPDALRSERYSLVKTAIEKNLLGDNLTGLREIMNDFADSPKALSDGNSQDIGPRNE